MRLFNIYCLIKCKKNLLSYVFMLSCFCCFLHFILVHVRLGSCSVNQSLVAVLMVVGANGEPGLSAPNLAAEASSPGNANVIIHLLRVVEEAV